MFEQISELEVAPCQNQKPICLKPSTLTTRSNTQVDFRGLFELLSKPLSPPEDLDRGLMSQPPSLLCDLVMRRAFP